MKKIYFLLAILFPIYFYGQSVTFSTVGSTDHVFPAGVTSITVQAWGGGGAGGGSTIPGLNVERAGAGGGGGAFAGAILTIPSNTTISVVVGAGGTGVNGNNGNAGSFSTITGYSGSLYAAGGSGGAANNAGGVPLGGTGGTILASVGTTKFAGAKGTDGQTGLLIVSGAGGQGGNSGGLGGAGVATFLGSTTGNVGSVPGGGGSGSISPLILGSNRPGGAGGSGRVIISYTCPIYTLTSTAGSIVNLCSGTSSVVTLTGNLPVGPYKVSYQVGGVTQTPVNMSVTVAGTGTFIAPGFTTLGNKTITITNLTSGSSATASENCSSTINSGNSAVITTSSSGIAPVALAGSAATCTQITANWQAVTGATYYELDLSTDINFGSFVSGYNALNVGNVLTKVISSLATNTTYYYRVRAYKSPCISANSNTITYKTPIVPANVTLQSATNIVCSIFTANWSAEVNAATYLLDVATTSTFTAGTFVSGFNNLDVGNVTSYNVTGLAAGTTYYYRVKAKNGCGTGPSAAPTTVATINTLPGTAVANAATFPICTVFNANWNTLSLATSYLLDVATTATFTAGTFLAGFNGLDVGNVTTYSVPVPTSGATYYYRIKGKNGCGNSVSFSNVITVTTSIGNPTTPTGVVSSNIWCTQFSMSWNSVANAITYDVQISTAPAFPVGAATQTYTGITATTYIFTGLTAGTPYYYRVLAKNGCGSSSNGVPSPTFITTTAVPSTPTISPAGSVNFCQTGSLTLTSSANTNNVWSTGETTKSIIVTAAGSYTVKVVNSGGCDSAVSLPTIVTVDGLPTASAGGSQTICANGTAIISGASATNGSILWTINGGSGTLTNAATLTPTYTPSLGGPARSIVLTMTVTSNNTCTSQIAIATYTVNVQAAPTAISSGSQIICPNGSATVSGATAANGTILWSHNGSGSLTNQTTETPTYTAAAGDTGNQVTLTMTVTASPVCTTSYTATATYPVVVSTINTVAPASLPPTICANTAMPHITRTTTGATGVLDDGVTGVHGLPAGVSASWASNTITISGTPTATGIFNYTIPLTGGCGSVNATGTFTVNSIPVPTFSAQPAASVCANTDVTYTTQSGKTNYIWNVPGVAGTNYTIISGGISATDNSITLQWLTSGNKTVTVSYSENGCPAVTNTSNITTVTKTERGVVNGGLHICSGDASPLLTLHNYVGTIVRWEYAEAIPYVWQTINNTTDTYQPGILTTSTSYRAIVKDGTCSEEFAIETRIDVDQRPSAPTIGTIIQPTCIASTGSIVLNGLLGTNWIITQNHNGTFGQTHSGSGTSFTIPNLVPGTYAFAIQEAGNCPSLPTINVEIEALVTNTWNGSIWSKGSPPINTDTIEFSGDYQTTGDLHGCSCIVDSGINVIVNSGHTLTITNSVNNNGGTLTFENNASLMQINNAVNTGNIIYKRNTTLIRRYDFTYWSSPVTRMPDFTLHDLSPSTLGDKYYKYDPLNKWVVIYNGAAPMVAGAGYIIRAPQYYDINIPAAFNGAFTGIPNNGPVSVPLIAAEKWSLIGNPYPSAVYADQFIFDNSANLYGTLYFWTHNTKPSGSEKYSYDSDDYAVYNLTGSIAIGELVGDGATSPGNQDPPLGYIAAGQSFFAKSITGLNAVFTNTMRVPGNNSQFFKSGNNEKKNIERHRLWINLTNTDGAFKQILIGYVEGATNSWDNNFDGVTLDGNKFLDFYSINEDKKLIVQGRALPFVESDFIPLGYRASIEGDFSISIDRADGHLSNQPVYLEDKTSGIMYDLRTSNYTFTTTIGTFTDRFVLRYTDKTLGTGEFENQENNVLISIKDKNIKLTSTIESIAEVSVFDLSGKLLYNKKKIDATDFQIHNLQSGNQLLLVKVTLENGNTTTRKIIFY